MITELAQAIAAIASDDFDHARSLVAGVHTRLVNRGSQSTFRGMDAPPPEPKADEARRAAIPRLFAYWRERCQHPTAKMTPDRARCIGARLREGYSEAEIRKAIDGAAVAAYVNDEGHKYDDLTLICRNGSKLESFINRGVKATGEISVELDAGSPVEEKIATLRRQMVTLQRDGRSNEYQIAAEELRGLMAKRAR